MKKQSAFTLIELMITMAIIAILATAGILAYADYTKKGRDTARAQIAQNLNSSVMAYAASNEGNPPADSAEFEAFLASADETFGGDVSGGDLSLIDPVGGKDVCLDADGNADEPCRFDYTAYADGTYAISYGVEHKSSTEGNFYKTTKSVLSTNTEASKLIDQQATKPKYGVYIGSAPFIGQPAIQKGVDDVSVNGIDENQTPALQVSFRGIRLDIPQVSSGGESGSTTCSPVCGATESCINGTCTSRASIAVGQSCGTIGGYGTVKAADGRCWFATNLPGYYQWGRADNVFTNAPNPPYDWSNPQDSTLWEKVGGVYKNNPCPQGSHVPTQVEWQALVDGEGAINIQNSTGTLRLPKSGYRDERYGIQKGLNSGGGYWSSTLYSASASYALNFSLTYVGTTYESYRANGFSIRCIAD